MVTLAEQAKPAMKKLLDCDEQQLYEQLGIRARAIEKDPTKASAFEPQITYDQNHMGIKEDVYEFGENLFRRWNIEAYNLICGSDLEDQIDREGLVEAFKIDKVSVGAALSALLATQLGLSPALAAVAAALLIKRFFNPAYEEFCILWEKHL